MKVIRSFVYVAFVLVAALVTSSCTGSISEPTPRVTQCEVGSTADTCVTVRQNLGPSAEVRLKMVDNPSVDSPMVAKRESLQVVDAGSGVGRPMFSYSMAFNMDRVEASNGGYAYVYMSDDGVNSKGDAIGDGKVLPETNTYVPNGIPGMLRPYEPFNYFLIRGEYFINGVGKKYVVGVVPAQ